MVWQIVPQTLCRRKPIKKAWQVNHLPGSI